MVGLWGPIRFRVSDSQVLTFQNLKRNVSGNWNEYERIGMKPLPQFTGPALQEITMDIVLDASLGVRPKTLIKKIERMTETGQVYPLVLGKRVFGSSRWRCVKSSEAYEILLHKGEIYRAKVSLTMKEYL